MLAFVPGSNFKHERMDLQFYAMNGHICLHDETTGEYITITRREWLQRAEALAEDIRQTRSTDGRVSSERRFYLQQLVEKMIACAVEAKEQGDMFDPQVAAWFQRHRPSRRSRITLASLRYETNTPGGLPSGRITRETVRPDYTVSPSKRSPLILPDRTF